jgi:hypothetical protein
VHSSNSLIFKECCTIGFIHRQLKQADSMAHTGCLVVNITSAGFCYSSRSMAVKVGKSIRLALVLCLTIYLVRVTASHFENVRVNEPLNN